MKYLTIFLLVISINAVFSQNNSDSSQTGIIYGEDHAFAVTAPSGWVLDTKSGVSQGIYAVFYPEGSSWENAMTVMYVNTSKKIKGQETIEELIEYDVNSFKQNSPNIKITDGENIITGDGKTALVKIFTDEQNSEAVAYIDEKKIVALLIISSRKKDELEKSIEDFKKLVSSYILITDEVIIDKENK